MVTFLYILHCMGFSVNSRWWGEGGRWWDRQYRVWTTWCVASWMLLLHMQEIVPVDFRRAFCPLEGGGGGGRHTGTRLTMALLTVDFRKQSGPTPADGMAAQIITDCGNFTLDFKQRDSVSLHSSSRLWKTKCTFIWKEDFGPLSNSIVIFLFSPGKMFLMIFLFQKWLGSPFTEDIWARWLLMHWLQLQFTPCESLPSVWIGFA